MAREAGDRELFCISAIVGGGPMYTLVLGANFHRAYYTVYEYDAYTDTARVSSHKASIKPGDKLGRASACSCSEGCMPCSAVHAGRALLHARHARRLSAAASSWRRLKSSRIAELCVPSL